MPHLKSLDRLAVLDIETEPFKEGRVPECFAVGFYDGETFEHFWEPHAISKAVNFLRTLPRSRLVYAHNGGNFDYMYFLDHIMKPFEPFIINCRLARFWLWRHDMRDSFIAFPVPLAAWGGKQDIDYRIFEKDERNQFRNRKTIVEYLEKDCTELYDIMYRFIEEFGPRLTMPSASLRELAKLHPYKKMSYGFDSLIRDGSGEGPSGGFYHGGRVEALAEGGVYHRSLFMHDVNSMYPYVMREFRHPIGNIIDHRGPREKVTENTFFLTVEGDCRGPYGAFPVTGDDGSLCFPRGEGRYSCTIHEYRMALKYGWLSEKHKLVETISFEPADTTRFVDFIDTYFAKRRAAQKEKAKFIPYSEEWLHWHHEDLFWKVFLNASYGKFALNPRKFREYRIERRDPHRLDSETLAGGWKAYEKGPLAIVYVRPIDPEKHTTMLHNVATAASITGAARAVLLEGMARAKNPLYVDTDMVLSEGLDMQLGDNLGEWKEEARGNYFALAGKKLYAFIEKDAEGGFGRLLKAAHKGANLRREDGRLIGDEKLAEKIIGIANGAVIEWRSDVPNYSMGGGRYFVNRQIKRTAKTKRDLGMEIFGVRDPTLDPCLSPVDPDTVNLGEDE